MQQFEASGVFQRYPWHRWWSGGLLWSALVFGFGEGAQLFGVDVPQLLQLPLASSVQILDMHHVCLLDASVLSELVSDPGEEARFVLAGSQEVAVQSEDLLLQLAVPRHDGPQQSQQEEPNRPGSGSAGCYRGM